MADAKKVTTPTFTGSFLAIFEAKSFDGGEPKYSICAIFDKPAEGQPDPLAGMKGIAKDAALNFFKGKLPANLRNPLRDGAEKDGLEGYGPGVVFCNLTSKNQPGLVDGKLMRIMDRSAVWAGCKFRATVTAYAYEQKGNKGVAFGLHNLQLIEANPDKRLDGRAAAEKDFSALDVAVGEGGTVADKDFLS